MAWTRKLIPLGALVVAAAYVTLQAFDSGGTALRLLRGSLVVFLVGGLCWGVGRQLDARLRPASQRNGIADHGLALLLGQAALALLGAVLAQVGLYRPAVLGTVLFLLVPLAVAAARSSGLEGVGAADTLDRWLRAVTLIVGGAALAASLVPVSWFDALQYHAALPALYLMEGGRVDLPHNVFAHLPHLWEMHLGFALALDHEAPLGFLAWLDGAAGIAAAMTLAERLAPGARWLAAALLASAWEWSRAATSVDIDLFLAALGAHALLLIVGAESAGVAVAVLLGGFAIATKLQGVFVAMALAAAVLVHPPARARLRERRFWWAFGAALLIPAALTLPTWRAYGAPYWPFGAGSHEARFWSRWLVERARAEAPDGGHLGRLPGLLAARLFSRRGWNPAVLLGACGAILLLRRERHRAMPLFAFLALFAATWLASARVLRYALPALPVIAALAAAGARRVGLWLAEPPAVPRTVAAEGTETALLAARRRTAWSCAWLLALGVTLFAGSLATVRDIEGQTHALPFLTGKVHGRELLDAATPEPPWDAVDWINAHLPADARVASLGEPRLFHLWRPWRASTVYDSPLFGNLDAKAPDFGERILAELRRGGFTHLLTNAPYSRFLVEKASLPPQRDVPAGIAAVERVLAADRAPLFVGSSARVWSLAVEGDAVSE